mmetsp:Transcript_22609/g.57672  ORF Transcript_22609/g.57672 Transcript_22609/m.57672 type:complete len:87 (+) Transcript_22609:146-406(+)
MCDHVVDKAKKKLLLYWHEGRGEEGAHAELAGEVEKGERSCTAVRQSRVQEYSSTSTSIKSGTGPPVCLSGISDVAWMENQQGWQS